uniref:Outer membrane protein n=1 Tax=Eleftheria terrae TaxID=1597781 RepID=A0A0B5H2X1_9BURK|nr:outer membrane protein [Eleftheria terrae]
MVVIRPSHTTHRMHTVMHSLMSALIRPMPTARPAAVLAAVSAVALLSGCAALPSSKAPAHPTTARWSAPLPHGGQPVRLVDWWRRFDDPALAELIAASQSGNPGLAQATARIRQARAQARMAGAAVWPALDARAGLQRSGTELPPTPGVQTNASATLDASWEVDLFGANRRAVEAALAREASSQASWHDARVSLAAEVAAAFVALRACEAVVAIDRQDEASLRQVAELTHRKVEAGFEAPANAALARASAAESTSRRVAQQAECDVLVKQLSALAVLPEDDVRARLAVRRGVLPVPAGFEVEAVPAGLLQQRPDLAAAEHEIAAAAAEVGAARAERYPRLTLTGSIGRAGVRVGGETSEGRTWSIVPQLVLPLLDAGRRRAAVEVAEARYDEALAAWRRQALGAVREVEEALVRLDAADRREGDALRAAQGYAEFLKAAQTQYQVGSGSLLDLEQARRQSLAAEASLVQVRRDRVTSWVSLYKALGGGWQPELPSLPDPLVSSATGAHGAPATR